MNSRNESLIKRYASHPLKGEVESALTAAEKFVERAPAIKSNPYLSVEGRGKALLALAKSTLRDIRDAGAPIDAMKTKMAALVATIKSVSFAKDDLAGAVLRSELRSALRGMTPPDKAAVLLGDKADPLFADAALEAPALLSGVDPHMFEKVREQRLETLFSRESFEVEALTDQIAEANAGLEVARNDVQRASGLLPHEFAKLVEEVRAKRDAPWLLRTKGPDGEERVVVVKPGESNYPLATARDLHDGIYHKNREAYLAHRAA